MTCSSNTTSRPRPGPRRRLLLAVALAGASLLAALPFCALDAARGEDAGTLIAQGKAFLAHGDTIGAEAKLQEALRRGASRPAVASLMGRIYLAENDLAQARSWLGPSRFTAPTELSGLLALAELDEREKRTDDAAAALNRAIDLAPKDATMWIAVARFRYRGGQHLLAIEAADYAYALDPGNRDALLMRAELVRDREGMVPALAWFEKALEKAPDDLAVLGEYAATLGEAGRAEDMLETTRHMLEIDPGNARAYYLQAVMAARAGKYPLARRMLQKTGDRLDDLPGAMLLEGVLETAIGNYTLGIEALEPLVARQPDNARARALLARAMFGAGEYKLLTSRFADAAAGADASPYLQTLVGRSYEQLDRRDLAAPFLDLAARGTARPVRIDSLNQPVGAMLAAGNAAGASALVGQWLAANPGKYEHLELAGDIALARGNGAEAASWYAKAAAIRMDASLMQRRLQALMMTGDMRGAVALAERFLSDNPGNADARRTVGWLSALGGNWSRARDMYQSLNVEDGRDVQQLCDLSLVRIRAGDVDGGLAAARRAYGLQRANPVAAAALGIALVAKGGAPDEARSLLDKARAIMGDNAMLIEARIRLAASRGI